MKRFLIVLHSIAFALLIFSCTKHAGDTEAPADNGPVASLVFASPSANAVFAYGDSVYIKAVAISTASIHGYDVTVHKAGDTSEKYFAASIHDHNDTLLINQGWKCTVAAPTNLEAEITLYLDHDGHTKKGKVGCRVQ